MTTSPTCSRQTTSRRSVARPERRARAQFDADAWDEDLGRATAAGRQAADAARRETVVGKYEKGEITQADKNKTDKINEQSGAESDVGR